MVMTSATAPTAPSVAGGPLPQPLACLVVEDHTLIGQLLVGVLRGSPGIGSVRLATTVAAAIEEVAAPLLDLVILDLKLPDGDGLSVLRAAAGRHPSVCCIVLSGAANEFACPAELTKHMVASINKTAPLAELRQEVEAVVRSRQGVGPEAVREDPTTVLRPRELEVFTLIGKGMTSRQIAESLGVSVNTVSTHRQAIASKLDVAGAELVRLATVYTQTR